MRNGEIRIMCAAADQEGFLRRSDHCVFPTTSTTQDELAQPGWLSLPLGSPILSEVPPSLSLSKKGRKTILYVCAFNSAVLVQMQTWHYKEQSHKKKYAFANLNGILHLRMSLLAQWHSLPRCNTQNLHWKERRTKRCNEPYCRQIRP